MDFLSGESAPRVHSVETGARASRYIELVKWWLREERYNGEAEVDLDRSGAADDAPAPAPADDA